MRRRPTRPAGAGAASSPSLGVPESYLSGKHGPCPLCGEGKDRFRFDDREGRGTWICSQCGAGDGMELAMRFTGLGFAEVASKIDDIIGNVGPDRIQRKPEMTDRQRRATLNAPVGETRRGPRKATCFTPTWPAEACRSTCPTTSGWP